MRILQVSNFYRPVAGGLEVYVDSLATELVANGHEVHVATLTRDASPADSRVVSHRIDTLTARLVRYERAERPFPPPLPDPIARRQLVALVRRLRPDVVHVHSALGRSLPTYAAPTVETFHDFANACQLGTLWRTDGQVCDGPAIGRCISCGSQTYGAGKSAVMTVATALGRRFAKSDAVLALSEYLKRAMTPYTHREIEVIPGFHRPPDQMVDPEGLPDGPFALFAGDPRMHKGIEVLLDAWRHPCLSRLPLVIAASRPYIGSLPEGVRCLSLNPEEMRGAWHRAMLAVVPSLWAEPFGLVAIEAMASGTPVVASRSGALPEIVTHGHDGVLVPPGDSSALAEAVVALVGQPEVLKSMGRAALNSGRRFAPEVIIPRIETIYERVVALNRREK